MKEKVEKSKTPDKQKKRDNKHQRKKGAPKWKNMINEIDTIKKRLEHETPPSGILYYKYKPSDKSDQDGQQLEAKTSEHSRRLIANRKVLESDDKSLIKIRFSDLPMSKATINGLFKAKYVKMTEV